MPRESKEFTAPKTKDVEKEPKKVAKKQSKFAKELQAEDHESLHEMIKRKAYELYEGRGGEHGKELDDWFEAENIVKKEKGDYKNN